jgi:hypothetical protein
MAAMVTMVNMVALMIVVTMVNVLVTRIAIVIVALRCFSPQTLGLLSGQPPPMFGS